MTQRMQQFAKALLASGALLLSLCVLTPLTLYLGNQAEFSSSYAAIANVLWPYWLLSLTLLTAVGLLLPHNGSQRFITVIAALAVLVWLQANILVWNYGPLDGRSIDWFDAAWRGALDALIWMVVLLVAFVSFRRSGRLFLLAALVVLTIQALPFAYAWLSGDRSAAQHAGAADPAAREALFQFSARQNVLHVILDGFQSDIFGEIIDDPGNADLRAQLGGFTFFRQNVGLYPYTQMSMPALLSGKVYRNHLPADEFVRETIGGNTILSAAADAGFEIDLAAPVSLRNIYADAPLDHAVSITNDLHASPQDYARFEAARLLDLALFRSVPHFAKALVHRDELWIFQGRVGDASYLQMQFFADVAFLQALRDSMTVTDRPPVYKLLHVMLAHRPTVGNRQCEFDGVQTTNRETVLAQAYCGLSQVVAVLERMQKLGLYENSTIVLMADHGAWVPLKNFAASPELGPVAAGMAVPLLAIKPPQASGPLRESELPTSLADLPATLAHLLEIDQTFPGHAAFAAEFPAERVRRHYSYAYGRHPENSAYLFPMQEFIIAGDPFDASAWRPGERLLPPQTR